MVRAKFRLSEKKSLDYGNGPEITLVFTAQYDQSIEEDRRFQKATPTGRFEMRVDNPTALAFFTLGKQYYIDMTEAE